MSNLRIYPNSFRYFIHNSINIFFYQDCIQPFGHEMLSWVRLRGIDAHSTSPAR